METNVLNYKYICEETCRAARRAGDFIRTQRKVFTPDRIEHKGHQDLVSYVDKQAETLLVRELSALVPRAAFITEEGTVEADHGAELKWIVDPLDGTTNFVHGLPPYCVSIALTEREETVVGVVYEITHDECFYAWKDAPALMNGEPIRVSSVPALEDALIASGLACHSLDRLRQYDRLMDYVMRHTHGGRRIGSAAADLVYVACGRFDAFSQFNLSPWDVAGGAFIVRQAGGVVSDYRGGTDYVFGKEIIASNPHIYEAYRLLVEQAGAE